MRIKPIVLDYETMPIESRPAYPPQPVSFSLQMPEWRRPRFYAWGHKTGGNNTSKEDARSILKVAYSRVSEENPLLCHNGKFDMDVSYEHFKLALPPWHQFQDTMLLLFLEDPHSRELALKPAAMKYLGMPPEEQDAVKEWLLSRKAQLEADFPEIKLHDVDPKTGRGGIRPGNVSAFIAYAPGNIVGPYANGDVERTLKLFKPLHDSIRERGMLPAYDRERQLLPILLENERKGIHIDEDLLQADRAIYEPALVQVDDYLRKALHAPDLDLDKDVQVAHALDEADMISEWTLTPTGKKSTSKKNLKLDHFSDPKVASAYAYRQKLATMLQTFIRPWTSFTTNGWMHTTWHQVRGSENGTRTGRPSTSHPNFLNMPKGVKDDITRGFIMPTHIPGLPLLPKIRNYIIPDEKGHVIGRRDFNQQELRITAHFEDGALLQAYLNNPRLDVHAYLQKLIAELLAMDIDRAFVKTLNFGYLYGQGLGAMAASLGVEMAMIKQLRDAQMAALPGLKALTDGIKARVREGYPITTWGGREYYVEEPRFSEKYQRIQTFDYKLLNYLIQGSAADITKASIIAYHAMKKEGRFILSVYDENNLSIPKRALKSEMLILRECMMGIQLDVPLLSDGEYGPRLGSLQPLVEKAPDLSKWSMV